MKVRAFFLSVLAFLCGAVMLAAGAQEQRPEGQRRAVMLTIEGPIGPALARHVIQNIERAAEQDDIALVILRQDTPGGLDTAMRDIIRAILASPVPVASWVAPPGARAASAGTYISYASHVAAMAPSTNLGSATPVAMGGMPGGPPEEEPAEEEGEEETVPTPRGPMERKVVNDAAAYIRGLAEMHGRNAEWAEQAVREAVNLTSSQAVEQRVVDFIATSPQQLVGQANGRTVTLRGEQVTLDLDGVVVDEVAVDWQTRMLAVITDPSIAYMLMLIGIYGIIFELSNPGAIFPGVIGATSLLVALFALNVLPIDYAGAALVMLGLALMIAEAFVPSFGLLGLGGAALFAFGSIMMFDMNVPGFGVPWPVILGATALTLAVVVTVMTLFLRTRRRPVLSGFEEMLGAEGRVLTWSEAGKGEILVHGERWQARAARPLQPGETVVVRKAEGLVLEVDPKKPDER
ncbi:nodulation protein NfeD [Telmatospirillum sp. J64-1]|uniref:NfeD family protein n=1 Tax=Telmatospirillum sp. J64-1 TaxID=2502183 RepID=UPI00115D6A5B|nr:nodulation protein NfeD [Telmatospirillum sp. J64-1]